MSLGMAILTFLTHPPTSLKSRFWLGAQSAHIIKMAPRTRMVMQQADDVQYVVDDVHYAEHYWLQWKLSRFFPCTRGVYWGIESLKS